MARLPLEQSGLRPALPLDRNSAFPLRSKQFYGHPLEVPICENEIAENETSGMKEYNRGKYNSPVFKDTVPLNG